jgi:hypothetical protein
VVAEPVGGSVEGDDDGSEQESVEHRGGVGGVAEDLAPGTNGPVRGDHDRRFQVALVDDLEAASDRRAVPAFDLVQTDTLIIISA